VQPPPPRASLSASLLRSVSHARNPGVARRAPPRARGPRGIGSPPNRFPSTASRGGGAGAGRGPGQAEGPPAAARQGVEEVEGPEPHVPVERPRRGGGGPPRGSDFHG